tara:strand:+ start:3992 stop:4936 length:945 start_codon:yes stop_codon:yes gene_type:complete
MKKWLSFKYILGLFFLLLSFTESCKEKNIESTISVDDKINSTLEKKEIAPEFKKYWYAGKAEITSYTIQQARYGELRDGTAVLIYVTEPFLGEKQVKADANNTTNIPVLKLNSTKNYITGIYPYSIMTSSFYPVYDNSHALKLSFSAQEWCGQVYSQLNNKKTFEITSHSYFENEADQNFSIQKNILENEIWNKIRINPDNLPVGNLKIIPSLEFIRLRHKELKDYNATAKLELKNDVLKIYSIDYPELERKISITFTTNFPHTIENWSETFKSGFGSNAKSMTTTAQKNKSIITAYWQQNKNSDLFLRDSLGL